MGFTLITPPAAEPVSVVEAVEHLRLDTSNVIAPPGAPLVALIVDAGNVDAGAHRYRVTFVTAAGETDGGQISAPVTTLDAVADDLGTPLVDETVAESKQVAITNIAVGGSDVIGRNLYRTAADGSDYFLLFAFTNNTATTYTDNIADADLGAGIPGMNTAFDSSGVQALIRAARMQAEKWTGVGIVTQVWEYTLDQFPVTQREKIVLPRGPVQSVDEITYTDSAGSPQTLEASLYVLESTPLRDSVGLVAGESWPVAANQAGAVVITFTVGYGSDATAVGAVAEDIKSAILVRMEDFNRNRALQTAETLNENRTACALLDSYRRERW
jgi:uncharacterized phiE125 gp8 family phage protein